MWVDGISLVPWMLYVFWGKVLEVNQLANTLYALREEGSENKWCKVFTPMPTPRLYVACVTTEEVLVAAGGEVGRGLFMNQ